MQNKSFGKKHRSQSTKDLGLKTRKLKNRITLKPINSAGFNSLNSKNNNNTSFENEKTDRSPTFCTNKSEEWTPIDYEIPENEQKSSFLTPRSAYVPQTVRNLKRMKKPPMTKTISKMQTKQGKNSKKKGKNRKLNSMRRSNESNINQNKNRLTVKNSRGKNRNAKIIRKNSKKINKNKQMRKNNNNSNKNDANNKLAAKAGYLYAQTPSSREC